MKSIHPWGPFIPKGANKLIIGTIPPPRFCKKHQELFDDDVNFYYGSRDNSFWPLIQKVLNKELDYTNTRIAIKQREEILKELSAGITDIIAECIHKNNSASDEDLKDIIRKDLKKLLLENEYIDTLIYTSEFVKKQINSEFSTDHSINQSNNRKQTVTISGKTYKVRILYSPSPQALRNMGENGAERRKEQYYEFLMNKV